MSNGYKHVGSLYNVIGFEECTASTIEKLRQSYANHSEIGINFSNNVQNPAHDNLLVIILSASANDKAIATAKRFHAAGKLTLIITSESTYWPANCYDSICIVGSNCWLNCVRSLLDPLIVDGHIHYDFVDLSLSIKGMSQFGIFESLHTGPNRLNECINDLHHHFENIHGIKKLALILYTNKNAVQSLSKYEITIFRNFISSIEELYEVEMAIMFDNSLNQDSLRISSIYSGKSLFPF